MGSFCRVVAMRKAGIPEIRAEGARQNGGSFCFILCAGLRRAVGFALKSHAKTRMRNGSADLGEGRGFAGVDWIVKDRFARRPKDLAQRGNIVYICIFYGGAGVNGCFSATS
jgi:hypothetical protein